MRKGIIFAVISLVMVLVISNTNAATTFLPDWQEAKSEFDDFESNENINQDEPFCAEAEDQNGDKLYHKASGCAAPKVFDEYCPYHDDWISECYCPSIFSKTCTSPYKGDTRVVDTNSGYASCDGWWVACCDTTCPSGTSKTNPGGCGGHTYNDCGNTCYYPYVECCSPASDETGCSCGTYSCSDGCGGTRTCCSSCPVPEETTEEETSTPSTESGNTPVAGGGDGNGNGDDADGDEDDAADGDDEEACSPLADETECSYGTKSCDNGCGEMTRTCCKTCADNGGSSTCSGKAHVADCTYGSSSTCTDCNGNVLNVCNPAPDCTPLSDEANCEYDTEDCDDGCGGTRKCCKACTPLADETNCKYGTESCSDGCNGTRDCCKTCTPKASETNCTNGTQSCDDGCGGTRTCCKACNGSATCTGSTTPCSSSQIKTNECRDCNGTTRYTCEARKCNDSGSYDGSACSQYSSWAGECMGGYQMKYTSCVGSGNTPGHGNGDCDVDSWNRCCEQCTGDGPAEI